MTAYYNEIDQKAAAWLRELIKQGHIAPGDVDERSIEDVRPDELLGYTQCHFFAGIGVWSYALRRAGWADDMPVWTGSCPCQPFSAAGKGNGFADERHLWPAFHYLIRECHPGVVFGEQVASKDGLGWLDLIQADLEGSGYASGAVDLCAAGVGAPHIRQRLWWVGERLADASGGRQPRGLRFCGSPEWAEGAFGGYRAAGGLEHAKLPARERQRSVRRPSVCIEDAAGLAGDSMADRLVGNARDAWVLQGCKTAGVAGGARRPSPANGQWRDADWLFCRDGKWRPVEPGTFPLAHGAAERVGRLRGYGNAIVAPAAQAFIEAYMETQWGGYALQHKDMMG